jgi:hypothetical protein
MRYPNIKDMGIYYASGRDPIFYAHHTNIDRQWEAWCHIMRTIRGNQTQVNLTRTRTGSTPPSSCTRRRTASCVSRSATRSTCVGRLRHVRR